MLGADTRSTSGSTVADKNCEKIHFIAPNIYCCGAGTAADTENTTGTPPSQPGPACTCRASPSEVTGAIDTTFSRVARGLAVQPTSFVHLRTLWTADCRSNPRMVSAYAPRRNSIADACRHDLLAAGAPQIRYGAAIADHHRDDAAQVAPVQVRLDQHLTLPRDARSSSS